MVGIVAAQFVAIVHGVGEDFRHARRQARDFLEEHISREPRPWRYEFVGKQHAARFRTLARLESLSLGNLLRDHPYRQPEGLRRIEIDLKEIRPVLHDVHMRIEMGDVDAPG